MICIGSYLHRPVMQREKRLRERVRIGGSHYGYIFMGTGTISTTASFSFVDSYPMDSTTGCRPPPLYTEKTEIF
jgi:hypothetical protein